MAAKRRFAIPNASEMEKDSGTIEAKSLFKSYKFGAGDAQKNDLNVQDTAAQKTSNTDTQYAHQMNPNRTHKPVTVQTTSCVSAQIPTSVPIPKTTQPQNAGTTSVDQKSTVLGNIHNEQSGATTLCDSPSKGTAAAKSRNCLLVNPRQKGNPILKHVRNVPWEIDNDIVPDYEMGKASCALFLSLKYHQLNPNYIHERLKQLGPRYDLRVLLVQVDVKDPHHSLKELATMCIMANCTLILAFSPEEAGRYLETYKAYENKPPDQIMERTEGDFMSKFTDCLTSVKSVNKTDAMTLLATFGSLENIIKASKEDLSLCPGLGPQKAQRLYNVFHEPFLKSKKRKINTNELSQTKTIQAVSDS